MSDDNTQTLEVKLHHPPGRGSTRTMEVPEGISREEAEEWAKDVFFENCSFSFNEEDFAEEDGDESS